MQDSANHWQQGLEQMDFFVHRLRTGSENDRISEARLPAFGMIFLTDGKVVVDAGGEPFLLRPGSLLLIPPRTPFAIRYYDGIAGVTLSFTEHFLKDASHPVLRQGEPVLSTWFQEDARFFAMLFEKLCAAWTAKDSRMIKSLLDLILCHIRVDAAQGGSLLASRFLDDIFKDSRPVGNVADYAAAYGVSTRWLSRCVRTYSNRSSTEWITIARISLAKELLLRTGLPIIDVASRVGMDDQSYFSRFFKKQVGMTPMQFRQRSSEKS